MDYISAGKVFAVLGVIEGIVVGLLSLVGFGAAGMLGAGVGVVGLVVGIVFGAIGGFIGGIIFALLYNYLIVKVAVLEVK